MKTGKRILVKAGLLAAGAVLVLPGLMPYAQATPVQIGFIGVGSTGHVSLTVGPDSYAGQPNGDPANAQLITGASGTFSDSHLNISNVAITGVLARNFATPADVIDGDWQPGDVPFPYSFSELPVSDTNPPVITYSDLFYLGGSPQSCWDYPFAGGMFDTYGVMFTLANGDVVDLWSDGSLFVPTGTPVWLTYGFTVLTPDSSPEGFAIGDYQFSGVRAAVPEPDFLWLFGAGVLGLFAWRRSAETRERVSRTF